MRHAPQDATGSNPWIKNTLTTRASYKSGTGFFLKTLLCQRVVSINASTTLTTSNTLSVAR
jgi:hypothetical protein